jgi:hypothetical protein
MIGRQQPRLSGTISLAPSFQAGVAESEQRSFRPVWSWRAQVGRTRLSYVK